MGSNQSVGKVVLNISLFSSHSLNDADVVPANKTLAFMCISIVYKAHEPQVGGLTVGHNLVLYLT